jgi:uncharacterized protein YjiS (DUF1127 family)
MHSTQGGVVRALDCFGFIARLFDHQQEAKGASFIVDFERITAMATYETSRTAPLGAITVFRMVQSVSATAAALQAWNSGRVTRKALSRLSNRELDDIGLCRGDIDLIGR